MAHKLFLKLIIVLVIVFVGAGAWAASIDLAVSAYTWTPDPVVRNGTSTFSVTVTNTDFTASVSNLTLVVNLPSNVDFSSAPTPSGCVFDLGASPKTLTCTQSSLAAQATWVTTFTGLGLTAGVQSTDATISAAGNSDPDTNNDNLPKTATVINGADLVITKTGPGGCITGGCTALTDTDISFNIAVTNSGPDPATTFWVTDNLPAGVDFTYQSATGANWTCGIVSTTVTCDYSGASIAAAGSAPAITLTGHIITTAGSITNGASVASTDGATGDPDQTNNGPSQVQVTVTQTTDLLANKTMVSDATGTTSYALDEAVTLTLSVTNQGPRDAAGVTITDSVPAGFVIGTLPSGCSAAGQDITCTVGNLSNGATSSNYIIPLTAPGSSESGTNTATPGRASPSAGTNTPASVNYTVAAATANLSANKTMVSTANGGTAYAYGEAVTLTLSVTNNGPQNATGVTIIDSVPIDFVIGTLPSGCSAAGQDITCTVTGTLNSGATSSNFVIPLTAPGTSGSGANTATPGRASPSAGTNTLASVNYSVAAPYANLSANKTMVSAAPGSTNGTTTYVVGEAVTLTLSATNLGLQDATGVTITDTVPAEFSIGAPPAGCLVVGQTIICTVTGTLANGATSSNFVIPLTALSTSSSSNTATVGRTSPGGGSDTGSNPVNYTIVDPYAHLTLTKGKTPSLVEAGTNITNTIVVTNNSSSSSAATGIIRVTDALSANETYVGNGGGGWSCSSAGSPETVTCDYDLGAGSLARNASLPNLVITTQANAGWLGNLANTACTGLSAGSPHLPADNSSSGNCATATIYSSPRHVDIGIIKTASIASPTHILASDTRFTYTLTVSNSGADVAPTVNISDPLPAWVGGSTTGSAVITGSGAGESCTFASTVTCTLKDLTNGAPRTITITVNRRLTAGSFTNTATVTTPDAIDTPGPKQGSVSIIIDPVADVLVTNIASAPNPVKVGVQLTYTTSITNNGPDTAAGVALRHRIDPARMSYVSSSASITVGGSCSYVASFVGAPYAGDAGIECTGFSLTSGESRQLVFRVIPVYPYPDALSATYTSVADITTTTGESNYTNSNTNDVTVSTQVIDLTVADNDPGYDPTAFGDSIVYQIVAQNNGPSQGTGFMLTVTPTPPAQGTAPNPYTMTYNNAGSALPSGASCSQATPASDVICYMAGSRASSVLAPNTSKTFNLMFDTGPVANNPSGSKTCKTTAVVSSYETGEPPSADALPANNSVVETTTVLPKTDLTVISKAVSGSGTFSLNEPFIYTVVVANYGPSIAAGVRVSDTLPSGLALTGAVTAALGSGPMTTNTCSSAGSPVTVTCDLGVLPVASGSGDLPNLVTITIPVKAPYGSYTSGNGFNTDRPNFATIAPLPNTSLDKTPGNDTSNTVNVRIVKSSIAGSVYSDNNKNDTLDSGEKITASVTFGLYGVDDWGNNIGTVGAPVTLSTSTGDFLFNNLPSGNYTVVETQPANYYDRFETAGTSGGIMPAAICDGTINCSSSSAHNTISTIALAADTAATGYIFQEYRQSSIAGYVYHDVNNDGNRSAGETTYLSGQAIVLSGNAYNGIDVCTIIGAGNCTKTTPSGGTYTFSALPPSETGYTISQTSALPSPYLDGKDQKGTGVGNVVAGSAGRATPESLTGIVLNPNQALTNHNFGELRSATISGYVFIDIDVDAVRDAGETSGVTGVTITLTGADDLGNAVGPTDVTTGANGLYSFTGLRPGTYIVTEMPPVGFTHTGAQAGSKGGSGGGVGVGNIALSSIPIVSNDTATGYNFGESGQGLYGFVYIDSNRNGVKDPGEPGITGVTVTLSGTTSIGTDVCVAISPNPCSVTTIAGGAYSVVGLPASNGAGYTLTEQSQVVAPLTNYADGAEAIGTVSGSDRGVAGNDTFTTITLALGETGTNYNFGEWGAQLSGTVYYDTNRNNTKEGGETGIVSVDLTLSGTTASGVSVCTIISTCVATTDVNGNFLFTDLPASNGTGFTITETQPVNYSNGGQTAGDAGGAAGVANIISGVVLGPGITGSGYLYGEWLGSMAGTVYYDVNNSGVKDAGESAISGVTITLSGTAASGVSVCTLANCTTTTDVSGNYILSDLPASNGSGYTITETQPVNYADGKETAGTSGGTVDNTSFTAAAAQNRVSAITFAGGATATGYLFGEQLGSLSGTVYVDSNDNGLKDAGESAISGVTITLSGTAASGVDVCTLIASCITTSDASGNYSFTDLPTSNGSGYTLTETQPVNYADGKETAGSLGGTLGAVGTSVISGINFTAGAAGTGYLFGELPGSLSGTVYIDSNDNGLKDTGESGISGVTVTLTGTAASGVSVCTLANCTTTTDGSGNYILSDLPASNGSGYTLTETQPVNYADGKETAGNLGGTAGAVGTSVISGINFTAGAAGASYLFGELLGSLSGTVYIDSNNNGLKDAGESGINGVTITLSGTAASGANVCTLIASCTTTSDASGIYNFPELPTSNGSGYTLTETQPVNYADGKETAGNLGGTLGAVGTSVISGINFTAGAAGTVYLFGELPGTLSGTVYIDSNNNGTKDAEEPGINGVTITLSGTAASGVNVCTLTNCTTTTDGSGDYILSDLPGSNGSGYTITETQPASYDDYTADTGTQVGTIGGAPTGTAAQNVISAIVLPSGGAGINYNFRDNVSSLAGFVYLDANDNGIKDATEPGLAGVTLTLSGTTTTAIDICATSCPTAVTAADGSYSFINLFSGTYAITETPPAGYLDGKETAGSINSVTVGTAPNSGYDNTPDNNRITGITLATGLSGSNYLFGESGGSLQGFVYADTNNNGAKDAGETGIRGVRVTLSGMTSEAVDVCTLRASCVSTSDANGQFVYDGVPPGTYKLVETHTDLPTGAEDVMLYTDGKENAGVAGGSFNNSTFGSQAYQNTIEDISVTSSIIASSDGVLDGYLFGEIDAGALGLKPPIVNGHVYMDRNHSRIRPTDGTIEGQPDWTVVLMQNEILICTTTTDNSGFYQFDNLHCPGYASGLPTGAGFAISFSKNSNLLPNVPQSGGNAGTVGAGSITEITLGPNDEITEQNLPLDPSGVVYDAVKRQPVAGAVVTITGPLLFDPATHLLGGAAAQAQTTGTDGLYQFFLQNAYPSGSYTLTITTYPDGYVPVPSVMIPVCSDGAGGVPLNVGAAPTPGLVQLSDIAPPVGTTAHNPAACVGMTSPAATTTQYYFSFVNTNGVSAPILNNHIPLDPVLEGSAILMTKTTPFVNVSRGYLIPYTLTATNISGGALANTNIRDQVPPGFKYLEDSAQLDGVKNEPVRNGRDLTWSNLRFAPEEKKTIKLILIVGSGVGEGEYTNLTWAINNVANARVSNIADATVRVIPDPVFDCSDIIGKVFDDKNANCYQDEGEPGIPNVRIATVRGLLVTSDSEGRFHVPCADIPNSDRGSNFIMKLDERTLPTGYRITTENPRVVRVTRGKTVRHDFGAAFHRVVRIELNAEAFEKDGSALLPQWQETLKQYSTRIGEKPSVVRIVYHQGDGPETIVKERIRSLRKNINDEWASKSEQCRLLIEEEIGAEEQITSGEDVEPVAPHKEIIEEKAVPAAPIPVEASRPEEAAAFKEEALLEDIYFDCGKYDIKDDARPALESIASWLKKNKDAHLIIEGNADTRGTDKSNLALGDKRSRAAMDYLVSQGIAPDRLEIKSYGEAKPLCEIPLKKTTAKKSAKSKPVKKVKAAKSAATSGKVKSLCDRKDKACWQKDRKVHFVITE